MRRYWDKLRTNLWFVPSLITLMSAVLAIYFTSPLFSRRDYLVEEWPRLFGASADGARDMLGTIAGSMMTVMGITFSVTIVTLALAASQYTSRILRNFMRDRVTQGVLGIYAGIFTFCLIVMRTIRSDPETAFVPTGAVTLAVGFAILGIAVLIVFIHHIATVIQASEILASVSCETVKAVDHLFPEPLGHPSEKAQRIENNNLTWAYVPATKTGYIQSVDSDTLLDVAESADSIVRMEYGVGDFVVEGTPLCAVAIPEVREEHRVRLQRAYGIDRHRTVTQDAIFGIQQMVDVALRALSPGVNDTSTGVLAVDYLTAVLVRVAERTIPSDYRSRANVLRVIALGPTFESMVTDAFDGIRNSAAGNLTIFTRLLRAVELIGGRTRRPERKAVLKRFVDRLSEAAERTLAAPYDREQFLLCRSPVLEVLSTNTSAVDVHR